jgi:hypothetical protein
VAEILGVLLYARYLGRSLIGRRPEGRVIPIMPVLFTVPWLPFIFT